MQCNIKKNQNKVKLSAINEKGQGEAIRLFTLMISDSFLRLT